MHVVEPSSALAHHGAQTVRARTAPFNIYLNGYGTVTLLEYTTERDEYARIDFQCLVPGSLRITVNRESVIEAETCGGAAFVAGLFFPMGAKVVVNFTNIWGGGTVAGTVSISPSPEEDLADAARDFFGLAPNFTADELRKAYRKATERWHPDKPGGSNDKMRETNLFHDALKKRLG